MERIRCTMSDAVTAAFSELAKNMRHLSASGQDVRDFIGAMGGFPVLVRLCAASDSISEDTMDDALVALNQLCLDEESVSDFICYGGLQVGLHLPLLAAS